MSLLLSVVGLSGEEIAKRRLRYESAKREGVNYAVSPVDALDYLSIIEFQQERITQLEDEIKEIRTQGGKQLVDVLTSLRETIDVAKRFLEKK